MPKRFHESYAGEDSRRHQEHADGEMIGGHHDGHANMPQEVIMKNYPEEHDWMPEDLNDGPSGIAKQIAMDNEKRKKHFNPKKV